MAQTIKFGPAGSPESFYDQGYKSSLEMPQWLKEMGLNAFEYQCGRGVKISSESAVRLGELAIHNGIALSVHSPYFTNISTMEPEKYENSMKYIMQTLEAAKYMRAQRIVLHMGSFKGSTREEAVERSKIFVKDLLVRQEENDYDDITVCLETMGKINQMGTLAETLEVCAIDDRLLPTIDFGHLNARTNGQMTTEAEFSATIDMIENMLGHDRAKIFHSHFSKIEYTENGGEVKHLTFEDTQYGPDFEPLANQIAKRGLTPVFICESAGTQAEDALYMKNVYERIISE
ncbi:MAG: TIM barrel protein [Eubacteriales bacterium]|nr:TIM barrel protein [Eubacteriales bacterium]